jgi:trimeric autotransporter adhesin
VKFHLNRFLRRVRIHGGEFDTSARAMYRVSEKGSLISYEKAFSTRADLRIVRGSTIERKQMSTKTTIKRLALVTVAALGLGVLSVAPSSAVPQADKLTLAATTASTTQGTAVSVNATLEFSQESAADTMTLTLGYVSAPSGFSTADVHFTNPATAVTTDLPAGVTTDTSTSSARVASISAPATAYVNKTLAVTLKNTAKVGTYVIRVTPAIVGGQTPVSVAQTITFTVAAKTLGWSTAFIGSYTNGTSDTVTADATLTPAATALVTPRARIDVGQGYGATAGTDTATAADAAAVVVTTDKGLVAKTTDYTTAAKTVTEAAAGDADADFYVFSNGDVGKATITITVGTRAAVTKTITFVGAAASLVAVPTAAAPLWATLGSDTTTVITSADSAATAIASVPTGLKVVSSDTSVATVAIHATNGTVTVTPVAAGKATITVTDPATSAAATAVTFPVTVVPVRSKVAPVISFDKAAYNVGELVTMTISSDMGDSATATLFTAALVGSASVVTTGTAYTGTTHKMVGGKVSYTFYAPAVSGSWTVTGTTGASVDLATAATVSKSIDIVNPGVDAATAAAELAEAAAQDATDAALDATEAATLAGALAQEAVDAVADLSTQVATLIAALKKQITTLTNLVIKIQKKVRA